LHDRTFGKRESIGENRRGETAVAPKRPELCSVIREFGLTNRYAFFRGIGIIRAGVLEGRG
jgi:hypothetical protein